MLEPLVTDMFASHSGVIRFTRDATGTVTGFVLEAGRVRNEVLEGHGAGAPIIYQ